MGRVALVTGASRGIGRGIALVLAERGADVVVNFLDQPKEANDVVNEIRSLGARAVSVRGDVGRLADVGRIFDAVLKHFGHIDILVNNAGVSQAKDVFQIEARDWENVLRTNLTGCFLCCQRAIALMAPQRSGRIVNIASVVAHQGALLGHAHYAASKSGQIGLTKTLARTAAPLGITVNAIAPGIIETDLLERTHGTDGVARLAASVPLGLGTPRDIGLTTAFLCEEGGRYITGATIDVNGGMYLR